LAYVNAAAAESAAAVTAVAVPPAGFAFISSARLDPAMQTSAVSSLGTTSLALTSSPSTKKPKHYLYREVAFPQAQISNEPTFEASVDVGLDHPCYNFTIGNDNIKEFYSPNYPNFYINNTDCQRVIRAPFGYLIKIEFRDQFHLEDATNCEYDFLEVRDGAFGYSTLIDKLCGPDFPRDIISSDRFLFLRFVSDDSIQYSGFRAVYSFIQNQNKRPEPPGECRFNKTGVSGFIFQSDIPAEYNNYSIQNNVSLDCMWNITVAPGYKMYINFKKYKLSIPNNCEANYIDIYEDKLNDKDRKHRFCGTQAEPFKSAGTNINIRYFARRDALSLQTGPQPTTPFGFEIIFTAFREVKNKEKCLPNEFDCEDSTCIDGSLKCDGVENCKYRYDEEKSQTCAESMNL
ncbi:PREDICTED: neuropilin and tolloid-like protein 2, partial [Rhagoletis zephyria]|uniref:neuropilin and tolloid-like protein 2 n=1 Tax=Rhagoletis zephyria TaxID=28612 RepID=UPI0008119332